MKKRKNTPKSSRTGKAVKSMKLGIDRNENIDFYEVDKNEPLAILLKTFIEVLAHVEDNKLDVDMLSIEECKSICREKFDKVISEIQAN